MNCIFAGLICWTATVNPLGLSRGDSIQVLPDLSPVHKMYYLGKSEYSLNVKPSTEEAAEDLLDQAQKAGISLLGCDSTENLGEDWISGELTDPVTNATYRQAVRRFNCNMN
jgi:hypothetical protein